MDQAACWFEVEPLNLLPVRIQWSAMVHVVANSLVSTCDQLAFRAKLIGTVTEVDYAVCHRARLVDPYGWLDPIIQ